MHINYLCRNNKKMIKNKTSETIHMKNDLFISTSIKKRNIKLVF